MVLLVFFVISIIISSLIFLLRKKTVNLVLTSLFVATQICLSVYSFIHKGETDSAYFTFDAIGIILSMVLSLLSITTLYHSILYLNRHTSGIKNECIYFASLVMLISSMTGAYFANHLAVMWVCIEATTLFVAMLIFHERSKVALEAAWKYLYVSSIGVTIAFMGLLFLSAISNAHGIKSLDMKQLTIIAKEMNPIYLKITFLLVLVGFSAKMGIVPLHTVTIDAHTAAPFPISAFISTTLMNVGFLGIFRLFTIVAHTEIINWTNSLLIIVGTLSIAMSSIQLLRIKHFKRMFAFSSLEHMGIIALALSLGKAGYYAAILHIVFHSFVKAGLFYQIGQVYNFFKSYWISDTGNYFKINPVGSLVLILGFISITAMPPSGLFISEFLVFKALFALKHYALACFILFLFTIIIYVFAKHLFFLLYSNSPENKNFEKIKINRFETISQFVLFGLVIYLGFNPPVFFTDLIKSAISF
jgi:hydrogenase-4 component F